MASRCSVCGETALDAWPHCPACGHPYPDDPTRDETASDDDEAEEDSDDDDDPDHLA